MEEVLRLSKTKLNDFHNICSWKYKLKYVDLIPEPSTPFSIYANEGKEFHKGVELFFHTINPFKKKFTMQEVKQIMNSKDEWVESFINHFVQPILLKSCNNNPKYYFPILQEKKIYNEYWNFSGVIDAVFINSKNDEYVLVDWKTGKSKSEQEMREELACYKLILDEAKILDKSLKYWAMFWVKEGRLFFEECNENVVEVVKGRIIDTTIKILGEKFIKNPNACYYCGYNMKFGGLCDEGRI